MSEKKKLDTSLMVTRKPFGPTPDELRVIGDRAMTLESVHKYIGCGNVRRLYVEVLDDDRRTKPPSHPFRRTPAAERPPEKSRGFTEPCSDMIVNIRKALGISIHPILPFHRPVRP